MKKELDNFEQYFGTIEELVDFLKQREKDTQRITVNSKSLHFCSIEKTLTKYKEKQLVRILNADMETLKDTMENSEMIVSIESIPYLIGKSAWISLSGRMGIYGDGFYKLTAGTKAIVLNERFNQIDTDVCVIIVNKKVRAIMSKEYAIIPLKDLFEETIRISKERFDDARPIECYVNHDYARCKSLFDDAAEELRAVYDLPEKFTPGLIAVSSDTGYSANKVGAFWKTDKGSLINKNDYIEVIHKGNNSMEKIIDQLPNLFLKYQNMAAKLSDLMMVELRNPKEVLKKAGEQIGLPNKLIKELLNSYDANYCTASVITAYDLCIELFCLPTLVDNNTKTIVEEKVGRAININFANIDGNI